MQCNSEVNKKQFCNCTYSCDKKGICCKCLHYHRKIGQLPACYFPENIEKTYDRSIETFLELNKSKKS